MTNPKKLWQFSINVFYWTELAVRLLLKSIISVNAGGLVVSHFFTSIEVVSSNHSSLSFSILVAYSNTSLQGRKKLDTCGIQTQSLRVEGELADHWTTALASTSSKQFSIERYRYARQIAMTGFEPRNYAVGKRLPCTTVELLHEFVAISN